jgi:hypothetical protein
MQTKMLRRLMTTIYPERLASLPAFKIAGVIVRWLRSIVYPKYPTDLTPDEQTAVDQALYAQRRRRLLWVPLDFAFKGVVFTFLVVMIGFHYKAGIVEALGLQDEYTSYPVSLQMPWGEDTQATLDCAVSSPKNASTGGRGHLAACKRITLHLYGGQEMAKIIPGAYLAPVAQAQPGPAFPGKAENVAALAPPPPQFKGASLEEALALASKAGYQVKAQAR